MLILQTFQLVRHSSCAIFNGIELLSFTTSAGSVLLGTVLYLDRIMRKCTDPSILEWNST